MHYVISCFCGLVLTAMLSCTEPKNEPAQFGRLPNSVRAGQWLNVRINGFTQSTDYVVCRNAWQTRVTPIGEAQFRWHAQQAGINSFDLVRNGVTIATKEIHVQSASARKVMVFVGAKTIIADGKSAAMIVSIPTDQFENPVADSMPVAYSLLRPNSQAQGARSQTRHLLAYQILTSQTLAGKSLVSAQVGNAKSAYREITEVPGPPVNFSIGAAKRITFAEGHEFFTISTAVLTDTFGNVVSDGTLVQLICRENDGTKRLLHAYTMDGKAHFMVQNPAKAGLLAIKGVVQIAGQPAAQSNELRLSFGDASKSPVNFRQTDVH